MVLSMVRVMLIVDGHGYGYGHGFGCDHGHGLGHDGQGHGHDSWQAAISWRASDDRQISLSASAERAFANFRDKKTLYFSIEHFRNKTLFRTIASNSVASTKQS